METMEICEYSHDQIVHSDGSCPVCKALDNKDEIIESKDHDIEAQANEIDELKAENNDLRNILKTITQKDE